jgi:hypothetical protein
MKIELMSNAEIKIHMKEMENEYEALQMKIKQCMLRMEELDKNYIKAKEVMQKRTKGWV